METTLEKKSGFKKTKIGWIPENWKMLKLKDVCTFKNGKGHEQIIDEDGEFILVNSKFVSTEGEVVKRVNECYSPLYEDEIAIVMSDVPNGKAIAKCFYIEKDGKYSLNQRIGAIRATDLVSSRFLYYQLDKNQYYLRFDDGVKQTNLRKEEVLGCPIPLPPIKEQQRISEILSLWEKAIFNYRDLILQLKTRKKGLMQKLFEGNLRLNDSEGGPFHEWKEEKLSYYLKVSKTKNHDLEYDKNDVLSVSGEYGIVNQIEFQGRSFAGASVANYGVVNQGDVVYTKSPLKSNPYGIIKVNKGKAGIVSTLYAVYKCKPTVNGEFIEYYFQLDDNTNRYLRPLVQKGTKNDMKINNEKVLIDPVLFPSLKEQEAIVEFLNTVDEEISYYELKLEQLETQKKGLMQQLLTGQKRVKV